MEILVAYYPLGEVSKIAKKFEELAKARKINIDLYQIRTDQTDINEAIQA